MRQRRGGGPPVEECDSGNEDTEAHLHVQCGSCVKLIRRCGWEATARVQEASAFHELLQASGLERLPYEAMYLPNMEIPDKWGDLKWILHDFLNTESKNIGHRTSSLLIVKSITST